VWDAVAATGLPLHFHTIGGGNRPDTSKLAPKVQLAARAAGITAFQMYMADVLLSMIFCGVLERHPGFKVVIGEAGIELDPVCAEPHGRRVGGPVQRARPQDAARRILAAPVLCDLSDRSGRQVKEIGDGNIMWASDFPHPDGIWPDSQEYIEKELGHLPAATRHKIVCENAAKLYRFVC